MIEFPKLNTFQIVAISFAVIATVVAGYAILVPVNSADTIPVEVKIEHGQGIISIARTLKSAGLIRTVWGFVLYSQAVGEEEHLQAGTYKFTASMNIPRVVSMLAWGLSESNDISVLITEGENVWEIDRRLTAAGLITEGEFARRYIWEEGFFFPDTYRFSPDATVDEIAQHMKWNFTTKVSPFIDSATIITASLLEKEGKTIEDKALIAGIIKKRLELNMPLQVDAAVAYGACLRRWLPQSSTTNCDVTLVPIAFEIGLDSEYNTYLRKGLPPGPIANPGLEAIYAAQNPIESDYLYYLSPRDGGSVIFAKTAWEHAQNRKKYLGI